MLHHNVLAQWVTSYDRLIADNNTAEGRAMNRRVYAIITGNKSSTTVQTKDMNVQ